MFNLDKHDLVDVIYFTCSLARQGSNHARNFLLVLLVLFLVGGLPHCGYSRGWGYGQSGLIGLKLVIYLVLVLIGRIPPGF